MRREWWILHLAVHKVLSGHILYLLCHGTVDAGLSPLPGTFQEQQRKWIDENLKPNKDRLEKHVAVQPHSYIDPQMDSVSCDLSIELYHI